MNELVESVRKNVRAENRTLVPSVIESCHTMNLTGIAYLPVAFGFAKSSGNPSQAGQPQRMTRRRRGRVGRR